MTRSVRRSPIVDHSKEDRAVPTLESLSEKEAHAASSSSSNHLLPSCSDSPVASAFPEAVTFELALSRLSTLTGIELDKLFRPKLSVRKTYCFLLAPKATRDPESKRIEV